jgi:hypothetical protein
MNEPHVYRKVLRMVSELHVRGYQRLRIAPGLSASGCHWRCAVTPITNISSRHGARMGHWDDTLMANYSTGSRREYFGWKDAAHATPSKLADLFIARFPTIAEAGKGSDWLYVGWYLEMLHVTYPDALPIAYADWKLPDDYLDTTTGVHVPLPPRGVSAADMLDG